jgi:hypothetical protein
MWRLRLNRLFEIQETMSATVGFTSDLNENSISEMAEGAAALSQSWRRSLRQGAKVGRSTRRTIAHEDPEAFYGRVQGQGRA